MKEEEIRPKKIFDEYLSLAKQDTEIYFSDVEKVYGFCPACEAVGDYTFDKNGFSYEVCSHCQTLYVNPRPVASAFLKYYTESPSSKFWASTFYKKTAEARREKLWKPKARLILQTLEKHNCSSDYTLVDVGGGFGLFAEEIRSLSGKAPIVIEPGPELAAVCREKSLKVVEKFLEDVVLNDLPASPKAFVSFELFEHLHDPSLFLSRLMRLMNSGDLFIFTTLSGTGVDIQALWEYSKSVNPPHHLNFLNPRSVDLLLTRLGFESLSITTPGELDVDILANNLEVVKDRFWRTFIANATHYQREKCQAFISDSGWSSHMMVVCRKP